MKPYKLTMKTTVVVMASDALHAVQVAKENRYEIGELPLEPGIAFPVDSLADLTDEWDGECIPYGGDGDTRLKDLLTPNDQAKGRDAALSRRVPLERRVRFRG